MVNGTKEINIKLFMLKIETNNGLTTLVRAFGVDSISMDGQADIEFCQGEAVTIIPASVLYIGIT